MLEQWGTLGHPWHPNYKTKLGLSTDQVIDFSPDLTTGAPTTGVYAGTHGTTDPSSGTETPIHLDEQAPGRLNPTAVVPS